MWIVALAWLYVVVLMALAEATSPTGSLLGAVLTFLGYGVLPLALVLYLLGSPGRRRRRQAEDAAAASAARQAHGGGEPAGDAVAPKREEP
jgi:membrane protein implicated in regulation of membrane protease activity